MKGLLILTLVWYFFGVYMYSRAPQLIDLIFAINGILVAFIIIEHFKTKLAVSISLIALPNLFSELFLLIPNTTLNSDLTSVVFSIIVLGGAYVIIKPRLWTH